MESNLNVLTRYGMDERFLIEAECFPDLIPARVTAQHKGLYKIITNVGEFSAEISGKFRHSADKLIDFPTVGDFVMVSCHDDNGKALIHNVLTRKSIFLRSAVGVSGQDQAVASNIDTVFICMSLNNNFNLSRLERYLSVAWDSGATPVIILTKSDLAEDIDKAISDVQKCSAFSDIITVSMFDSDIIDKLSCYLTTGKTAAFIGSSGVGKSTIINKILGREVASTSDVGKEDKGRHTTTSREMFITELGGVVIDTPGMRELGAKGTDVSNVFDDIQDLETICKFSDCTHTGEPGCAIRQAIQSGQLDERRFNNYLKLKHEAGYEGLSSKEIEAKKFERFGGVKNLRKIGDQKRKDKYGH